MTPRTELFLPPPALASCVAMAVYRDTTGAALAAHDRLNYFPATPLFTLIRIIEGQLHMAEGVTDIAASRAVPPLSPVSSSPPHATLVCCWSRSCIRAVTVAIYPEAWLALGGS